MSNKGTAYRSLLAAASLLPGLQAHAEMPYESSVGYRFSQYQESSVDADQNALSEDIERYSIDVHQVAFELITGDKSSINGAVQYETLSGASPWFVSAPNSSTPDQAPVVMSGASIEEKRTDARLRYALHFKPFSIGVSGGFSTEKDYNSNFFGADISIPFNKKNTTVTASFSISNDTIEPTYGSSGISFLNTNNGIPLYNDAPDQIDQNYCSGSDSNLRQYCRTDNEKQNISTFVGLSQVVSKTAVVSFGISYNTLTGYLSDPYKLNDSRPDDKRQFVTSAGLRKYLPRLKSALHFDFRYYNDSWEVDSYTFGAGWAYNYGSFMVMPSLRYYQQAPAFFYDPHIEANSDDSYFFSNDARLSPFSAVSSKLKLLYTINNFSIHGSLEVYASQSDQDDPLTQGFDNPGLIDYTRGTFGVDFKF